MLHTVRKRSPLESRAIVRWRNTGHLEGDRYQRTRSFPIHQDLPVPMADSSSLLPPQSFRVSRMQSWLNLCFTARGKKPKKNDDRTMGDEDDLLVQPGDRGRTGIRRRLLVRLERETTTTSSPAWCLIGRPSSRLSVASPLSF